MTPAESKKILDEVKSNLDRLERCAGPHAFESIPDPRRPQVLLGRRYRCAGCGGEVSGDAYRWYARGLAHGVATGRAA